MFFGHFFTCKKALVNTIFIRGHFILSLWLCDKTEIDDFKDDDNREDAVYEKLSMVYNKNLILNHYIVVCTKDKIPLLLSKVNDKIKPA